MTLAEPAYLDKMTEDERAAARCRFLIRLAALHCSADGRISTLSGALGLHPNSLAQYSTISGELAVKLEELLGADRFPRSLFRPDLFLIQE